MTNEDMDLVKKMVDEATNIIFLKMQEKLNILDGYRSTDPLDILNLDAKKWGLSNMIVSILLEQIRCCREGVIL